MPQLGKAGAIKRSFCEVIVKIPRTREAKILPRPLIIYMTICKFTNKHTYRCTLFMADTL